MATPRAEVPIRVRLLAATPGELRAVAALVNVSYRTAQNWTSEHALVSGSRATPASLLADARAHELYVAEHAATGDVIACVKTGRAASTVAAPAPPAAGYVGLFAVHPAWGGRGVGRALLHFAEARCRALGLTSVVMDVLEARHDILRWYERCGYRRTGAACDAAPVIRANGERLLVPTRFIVLQKPLA